MALTGSTPRGLSGLVVVGLGAPSREPPWVGMSSIPSDGVFGSSGAVWFVSVMSGAWP